MGRKVKELELLLAQGRISRREFVTRMALIGAAAAASPVMFSKPALASTPKRGGRLRIGSATGNTTDSLDPAVLSDTMGVCVNWQVANNLVEIDHKGNAIPELAESWEPSADAKTWAFRLRKGVEFNNGKSLEAADVIYSLNHHRGPKSKSGAKALAETIIDMKADGKDIVIFTLETGNADFPFILSDYHLTIFPDGYTDFSQGIGTGGYTIVKYEPGVRALTKRNPNYFKSDRAWFDEVETIGIADSNARTTALKTRKVDLIDRVDIKTAHLVKRLPGVEMVISQGFKFYDFPMLVDRKPYDNLDVRKALKYAVDREDMVKKIMRGYGTVGNDQPISRIMKYYDADLPQWQYDPEKAKFHMKKAGHLGDTFKLHVSDAAYQGAVDSAVLYQEHASKAGIKIDVVRESPDGYWSNVWINKPWCVGSWSGRPTCDMMFTVGFAADAAWNHTHWKNPKFNTLLLDARAELDDKKRGQMYAEMQALVSDDGGVIIPMFAQYVEAASTKLGHGPVAGNWELDGTKAAERWWFK